MGTSMKGDENMSKSWKVGSCLGVLGLLAASLAMAAPSGMTKADLEQKALLHKQSAGQQQNAAGVVARKDAAESRKAATAKLNEEGKVLRSQQRALFAQMKTNRDPALRKQFVANQKKLMAVTQSSSSLKGGK